MSSDTLYPIEQKTVDFYGDPIVAVLLPVEDEPDPQIYIPIRPICDYLGVDWSGQRQRIMRDSVLAEVVRIVGVTPTNRGGNPNLLALPVEFLHGWLFGISENRVKPDLQPKLKRYRRECFGVLWKAFKPGVHAALGVSRQPTTLSTVRDMALAVAELAEQQMVFETRLTTTEERLDRAALVVGDIGKRLAAVEDDLHPASLVNEAQAAEISQAVKALAQELTKPDSKRNQYQAVFGELYRRFGVSSYKNITTKQFPDVLAFLEDWRGSTAAS